MLFVIDQLQKCPWWFGEEEQGDGVFEITVEILFFKIIFLIFIILNQNNLKISKNTI
jgi:hypothetical protein